MKKKFTKKMGYWGLCSLLFLTIFAFSLEQRKTTNPITAVNAEVGFGRGPNCTSRGVCSVDGPGATGGSSSGSLSSSNAQIYMDASGYPVITIFKNSISVATKESQFINGYFEQIDEIEIPSYFSTQHSSFQNKKIEPGLYPVVDLEDRYSISFKQ